MDGIGWPSVPLVALGAVLTVGTLLWLLSLRLRDASIVDIFWGPFFFLQAAIYAALRPDGFDGRQLLVLGFVAVWAVRLATHIASRHAGKGEDERYARWRRERGAAWPHHSLLQVFWLQGVLAWIIGAPLLVALSAADRWTPVDAVAVGAWLVGFALEAIGDYQLVAFTRDPANRGRTMTRGLWSWSRHPNYFGDALQWWALWLLAAGVGGAWTIFAPILMTVLLVRVSGVGLLERTITERRPDYAAYMERTSAFLPWPPKRG
jgi:steroid 5-alpha reductase family enzyme